MAGRISPFGLLLLLLLSVPMLEIYLLISVGRVIGAGYTILIVILTAVLGAWLLRLQGLQTLARVQSATQRGEIPAVELVEGLMLIVCGALLLTPGFFTDGIGFLALIPAVRMTLARHILKNVFAHATQVHMHTSSSNGNVIEGTYRREDP